jgi:NAD(P)H-flavin reductase
MALRIDSQASVPGDPMVPEAYRIRKVRRETSDTFTIDLARRDGDRAFHFSAGQFNMLYVWGVGEAPVSISGNSAKPASLVHTIRAVGTVTNAMARLKRGDVLGVRGPFGNGWPVGAATGRDVVIAAGGIGIAPLRPAIYSLLADRQRYGKLAVLYGARTPDDLLYRRELERWRSRSDLDVHVTVDKANSDWRGSVGVVTNLIRRAAFDPDKTTALVCGPEVMMRFAAVEIHLQGVAADQIFLSMERNMKCAVGFCGHCQYGPTFICKDGPVFRFDRIKEWLNIREV